MPIRAQVVLTNPRSFFLEPKHPKQRQHEALRSFYVEVDFDMALLVIASGLYRRVAQHMRGYGLNFAVENRG